MQYADTDAYDLFCFLTLQQASHSHSNTPSDVECVCKQLLATPPVSDEYDNISGIPV